MLTGYVFTTSRLLETVVCVVQVAIFLRLAVQKLGRNMGQRPVCQVNGSQTCELWKKKTGCLGYMGVSKNRGTPKYMVYNMFIMENPIKLDDLGGKPTIFGNIHI